MLREAFNILNNHKIEWSAENIIEIESKNLLSVVEKICEHCRYPFLALRLLMHVICGIDNNGKIHISARRLSQKLDANYDTVTKCLKYLREIGVLSVEK